MKLKVGKVFLCLFLLFLFRRFLFFFLDFLKFFDKHITDRLRGNTHPRSRGVKFWVLVSPLVVFFSANLAPFQLGRLFLPCVEHIEYGRISGIVGLVKAHSDFPVNLPDFQPVHFFQSEKRVHKPDIAVCLRHSDCVAE